VTRKITLMVVFAVCAVLVLGISVSASEILFEDNFDGDALGAHWERMLRVNSISPSYNTDVPAEYEVRDGKLIIDAPRGDTYFDLKGYSLTGNFTIEIKFKFSSERTENPGNFMVHFHLPDDYISWWDSEGVGVALRRWDSMLSVIWNRNIVELDLWEALFGSDMYDVEHIFKITVEGDKLYLYLDDVEILGAFFEHVTIAEFPHGGFSFSVYDSIIEFDYIKVYR